MLESSPPDGPSGVDLGHHLLPAADGAVVTHLPQREVLYDVAHAEGGAGAALVERFAGFSEEDEEQELGTQHR